MTLIVELSFVQINDEGASEPGSADTRCNMCLTMKATRVATPCGHNVVCRPCAVSMTEDEIFHQWQENNVYATSIRAQHSVPYDWCAATSRHIVRLHAFGI
ncbi:hypothetical protein J6590_011179 [Homalodisca vitripennis]|nr:hypothetical protein J6590_011179 [Homalodisca vitripennis]